MLSAIGRGWNPEIVTPQMSSGSFVIRRKNRIVALAPRRQIADAILGMRGYRNILAEGFW
jgi:hypothetical protein